MYKLKKFFRQYRQYILSIGLIPLSAVVIFFGIYPAATRTYELYGELTETNEEVRLLRQKISTLQSLDEESLLRQLQTATSAIPARKDLPTLFTTVERTAAETGVTLSEVAVVNPGSLATGSAEAKSQQEQAFGAYLLPFSVSAIGDYDAVVGFFQLVTEVRRYVRLRTFTIDFPLEARPHVTINMDAFYTPLPQKIAGGTQELPILTADDEDLLQELARQPNYAELAASATVPSGETTVLKDDPFSPF